jgi:hypothetical protein
VESFCRILPSESSFEGWFSLVEVNDVPGSGRFQRKRKWTGHWEYEVSEAEIGSYLLVRLSRSRAGGDKFSHTMPHQSLAPGVQRYARFPVLNSAALVFRKLPKLFGVLYEEFNRAAFAANIGFDVRMAHAAHEEFRLRVLVQP